VASREIEEILEKLKEKIILETLSSRSGCCKTKPSGRPVEVRSLRELQELERGCRVLFIMFYSPTCPYCRAFAPLFAEAAGIYGDKAAFARVNVYELPEAAAMYGVMGVPTTIAVVDGRPVFRLVGLVDPETFEEAILRALERAGCPTALQPA